MSNLGDKDQGAPAGAPFLILVWAGLAGAAGVGLSAVAAHKVDSPALATAATILTVHAAAAVAVYSLAIRSARPSLWSATALLMLAGASLFAGEITFHTFTDNAAFQFLAPFGGSGMILSWLLLALVAAIGGLRD